MLAYHKVLLQATAAKKARTDQEAQGSQRPTPPQLSTEQAQSICTAFAKIGEKLGKSARSTGPYGW